MKTMAELMAEEEARLIAEANTPERIAADNAAFERMSARLQAEHEKGVRLGWWNEDGESLLPEEDEEEEEDEDE